MEWGRWKTTSITNANVSVFFYSFITGKKFVCVSLKGYVRPLFFFLHSCLDRLDLAMQLMFQVVFRPGATVSFMTHIKRASYHHLTGIYHEFISGLAKMAYSDVPGTGYFNEQQESRLDLIGGKVTVTSTVFFFCSLSGKKN